MRVDLGCVGLGCVGIVVLWVGDCELTSLCFWVFWILGCGWCGWGFVCVCGFLLVFVVLVLVLFSVVDLGEFVWWVVL